MGDPNGIGPEVVLRSISDKEVTDICEPIIYGSLEILQNAKELIGSVEKLEVVDVFEFKKHDLKPGRVDKKAGQASLTFIEKGVKDALEKNIDAVVTAPISKESIHLAGSHYPGHTEMLKDLTCAENAVMLFEGSHFRVALVSIHVALSDVPLLITKEKVLITIRTCNEDLKKKFKIPKPKIVVCGLNPHAGEAGAFGREEIEEIKPAIDLAKEEGIEVSGPLPADTLFHYASKGDWDLVIAMYHDQGLIPFKMLSFDTGVNVTLGLPIIRTSPDHGTAFDIAWKGVANPSSMIEAIKMAVKISE